MGKPYCVKFQVVECREVYVDDADDPEDAVDQATDLMSNGNFSVEDWDEEVVDVHADEEPWNVVSVGQWNEVPTL